MPLTGRVSVGILFSTEEEEPPVGFESVAASVSLTVSVGASSVTLSVLMGFWVSAGGFAFALSLMTVAVTIAATARRRTTAVITEARLTLVFLSFSVKLGYF